MKKCDVEYVTDKELQCGSKLVRKGKPAVLFCTRYRHHKDDHHAHNKHGRCYAKWGQ